MAEEDRDEPQYSTDPEADARLAERVGSCAGQISTGQGVDREKILVDHPQLAPIILERGETAKAASASSTLDWLAWRVRKA